MQIPSEELTPLLDAIAEGRVVIREGEGSLEFETEGEDVIPYGDGVYGGDMEEGRPQGKGYLLTPTSVYIGQFTEGRPHGQGHLVEGPISLL